MNRYVSKAEAARRLATKVQAQERVSDLEAARESERADQLRRPSRPAGEQLTREEFIAAGYHPDSYDWDGADRGL